MKKAKLDPWREHAQQFFALHGYTVTAIPEADDERADLRVTDDAEQMIVEVKGKEVSAEYERLREESRGPSVATLNRETGARNRLDGIVVKARAQLTATPAEPNAFRVLWVGCLSGDESFLLGQFEDTLYGSQDLTLFQMPGPEFVGTRRCFYHRNCSFFRCPEIDATILAGPSSACLCLNEFSPRAVAFRSSRLCNIFQPDHVIDPPESEAAGKAIAVRGSVDRNNSKAVWKYLLDTYGFMTAPIHGAHWVGMVSVPLADRPDCN